MRTLATTSSGHKMNYASLGLDVLVCLHRFPRSLSSSVPTVLLKAVRRSSNLVSMRLVPFYKTHSQAGKKQQLHYVAEKHSFMKEPSQTLQEPLELTWPLPEFFQRRPRDARCHFLFLGTALVVLVVLFRCLFDVNFDGDHIEIQFAAFCIVVA